MTETRKYLIAERAAGGYSITTHPHPARQTYPVQRYSTAAAAIRSVWNRTRLIQHQTRREQVADIVLAPRSNAGITECRETREALLD